MSARKSPLRKDTGITHDAGTLRPPVGPTDHAQGPSDAPVTLVEYGDYQCPYCGQAYQILESVLPRLGDRLRFVFRNFPLAEAHPYATHAAQAAEGTAAQGGEGKFWAMHDALYEHQQDSEDALDDAHLIAYAREVGVDADAVTRDLASGAFEQRVRTDFMSGVRSGVNGTPTFFINGVRFDGDWSDVDAFVGALEQASLRPA
jgi:protein-disulfide isomerase